MSAGPLDGGPLREVPAAGGPAPPPPADAQHGPGAMNGETVQRKVTVRDPQGFHMRPASAFAQLAMKFQSDVSVLKDGQRVNGKSPLELMFLGAEEGSELLLEAAGPDAREALDALAQFLAAPPPGDEPVPPKG